MCRTADGLSPRRASSPASTDSPFHDLRHAGLTLSAQAGATLAEVMRRAGHSSSAAALGYQHAAAHRDAEIAARLTELLAQGEPRA